MGTKQVESLIGFSVHHLLPNTLLIFPKIMQTSRDLSVPSLPPTHPTQESGETMTHETVRLHLPIKPANESSNFSRE